MTLREYIELYSGLIVYYKKSSYKFFNNEKELFPINKRKTKYGIAKNRQGIQRPIKTKVYLIKNVKLTKEFLV